MDMPMIHSDLVQHENCCVDHGRRTAEVRMTQRQVGYLRLGQGLRDQAAQAAPVAALRFIRKHGDEREFRGPRTGQALDLVERVEIALCASAEQQSKFAFDLRFSSSLQDRDERRQTAATGDTDQRSDSATQPEIAEGSVELNTVADLRGLEQPGREVASRYLANEEPKLLAASGAELAREGIRTPAVKTSRFELRVLPGGIGKKPLERSLSSMMSCARCFLPVRLQPP